MSQSKFDGSAADAFQARSSDGLRLLEAMRDCASNSEPANLSNTIPPVLASELEELIAASGIRMLPFPFANALTITSDIDYTSRREFFRIQKDLVRGLGLDFGDSIWLSRGDVPRPGDEWRWNGLGFYDEDFSSDGFNADHDLTHAEILREHHRGNIDHWHSFSRRGPRFFPMSSPTLDDNGCRARFDVPHPLNLVDQPGQHTCRGFPVLGLDFVHNQPDLRMRSLIFIDSEDHRHEVQFRTEFLPAGDRWLTQVFFSSTEGRVNRKFQLEDISAVEVGFGEDNKSSCEAGRVAVKLQACILFNWDQELFLTRLRELTDTFGVSTNLVTAHGFFHFYNKFKLASVMQKMHEAYHDPSLTLANAYHGRLEVSNASVTTLADDESSRAYCMRDLVGQFGLGIFRLAQGRKYAGKRLATAQALPHCTLDEFVYPVLARDGTLHYNLSAYFPSLPEGYDPPPGVIPEKTRASTFEPRLGVLLDSFAGNQNLFADFYTHLGAWKTGEHADEELRFCGPESLRLRNLAFNIGRHGSEGVWFTRASVLAHYCILMQAAPAILRSRSGNEINLERVDHPVLAQAFPSDARALYGLTFFVDDAAKARVTLDGEPITDLVRNPPDASGRPSVTIAHCGIRSILFDEAEPSASAGDGHWCWESEGAGADRPSDREAGFLGRLARQLAPNTTTSHTSRAASSGTAFGRLRCDDVEGRGNLTIEPPEMDIAGAQILAFWIRREPGAALQLTWETQTGGRFRVDLPNLSGSLGPAVDEADASYVATAVEPDTDGWERHVIPLYALDWHGKPSADMALPNHPPAQLEICAKGDPGTTVDLDQFEFGRPRVSNHECKEGGFIVGGCLPTEDSHPRVWMLCESSRKIRRTVVRPDGIFSFSDVPAGAYRFVASTDQPETWDEVAPIEVACHRFDILAARHGNAQRG